MTPAERTERRIAPPNFWNRQGENMLDRATAMMPKLLYERLDEIGTDFAVIYPGSSQNLSRKSTLSGIEEEGAGVSQGPEAVFDRRRRPDIIAVEGDVLPAERCDVGKHRVGTASPWARNSATTRPR